MTRHVEMRPRQSQQTASLPWPGGEQHHQGGFASEVERPEFEEPTCPIAVWGCSASLWSSRVIGTPPSRYKSGPDCPTLGGPAA